MAGWAVAAQPSMPHAGQFFPTDRSTGEDARQKKIQNSDLVVHAAGGNAYDRDITDPADQQHGPGQNRRTVGGFAGPGCQDAGPGHIIGIDRHAAARHDKVGTSRQTSPYRRGYEGDIIRRELYRMDVRAEFLQFFPQHLLETVLDPAMKDLGAGDDETYVRPSQGQDLQDMTIAGCNAGSIGDQGSRRHQGNKPGSGYCLALEYGVLSCSVAHMTSPRRLNR